MKTEKQIRDMARYYYKKYEKEEDEFLRSVLINRIESFCMILECCMTELMDDDTCDDLNSKKVPLDITRHEVIDLELAVLGVVFDAEDEMKNPSTTKGRKKVLEGTIKKWRALHDKIKSQLAEFDKSYGF